MASQGEGAAARPKCYLIVHNVSKKHNIGTLVRSAVAFNVHQVIRQKRKLFLCLSLCLSLSVSL